MQIHIIHIHKHAGRLQRCVPVALAVAGAPIASQQLLSSDGTPVLAAACLPVIK